MSNLIGTWNYESVNNLDGYLKAIGLADEQIQGAVKMKPQLVIAQNGKKWIIKTLSSTWNTEMEFEEGVEFEQSKQ